MKNFILKSFRRTILPFFIIAFLSIANQAIASHAAGGDITYRYIGNNQYVVTFTFYRDCFGIPQDISYPLSVYSATCGISLNSSVNWDGQPGIEILPTCAGTSTYCNGGTSPGIQEYHYIDTITLTQQCPDWNFSTYVGDRIVATTIQSSSGYYLFVDANLNNLNGPNSSPTFLSVPTALVCIGQNYIFPENAFDADGDSLVYSFIAPRSNENFPLLYLPGYSINSPIVSSPPVSINSTTGDITMHPTQSDVAIIAVQITEYRNGIVIGTVMRDMEIYLVNCNNRIPVLYSSPISNPICAGNPFCFDINSYDPDTSQVLTMIWNNGIPSATFTTSGSPFPTGHFCWTPSFADVRTQPYTFAVTIRDTTCPMNFASSTTFQIFVKGSVTGIIVTPSVQCHGSHNGSATVITASDNLVYTWQFPNGTSVTSNNPSISHLKPGNYSLNVADTNGCNSVDYFTITEPPPLNVVSTTTVNAGCVSAFGSASVTVSGGTPGYRYQWSNGDTLPSIGNLAGGQYNVVIRDSHNCSVQAAANISNVVPAVYNIFIHDVTCPGNDGSVTVTHTGGTGPFSYIWSPDVAGDTVHSSVTSLLPGAYNVTITDWTTGCTKSYSDTVYNTSGMTAVISSHANADCLHSSNGSATVQVTGGNAPYSFLWSDGDTTQTTHRLRTGIQNVIVTDHSGCRAIDTATIGFTHPDPAVSLGPDTMPCLGRPMVIFPVLGPGYISYVWSPGNISGQPLIVNTSGTYSILVTSSFGCKSSDTINVNFITCFTHHHSDFEKTAPEISVYPNPADDHLNVSIGKIKDTDVTLRMTDILGNNLYYDRTHSENDLTKIIDIHLLPAGIYILRIEFNDEIDNYRVVKN